MAQSTESMRHEDAPGRPFGELRDTGLLWLINRTVFHPRGFALGLGFADGADPNDPATFVGWRMFGDGAEPWRYADEVDEDELFTAVEAFFASLRPTEGNSDAAR